MIFWLWVAVYLMPSAPFVKAAFAQYAQARAEYTERHGSYPRGGYVVGFIWLLVVAALWPLCALAYLAHDDE